MSLRAREASRSKFTVSEFIEKIVPNADGTGVWLITSENKIYEHVAGKPTRAAGTFSRLLKPAFSPDGKLLIAGKMGMTNEIEILDGVTLKPITSFKLERPKGTENAVIWAGVAPGNKTFAVTQGNGFGPVVRDAATGKIVKSLPGSGSKVYLNRDRLLQPFFSPDGGIVYTLAGEVVRRWDVAKGEELGPIGTGPMSRGIGVFSPSGAVPARNGKAIVIYGQDGVFRIWGRRHGQGNSGFGRLFRAGSGQGVSRRGVSPVSRRGRQDRLVGSRHGQETSHVACGTSERRVDQEFGRSSRKCRAVRLRQ